MSYTMTIEAPVSARVHALRGVVRLPEDFDEREFKSERLKVEAIKGNTR